MKTVRIRNKNIYVKDIVIAIIIAVLPFLFYIYRLAPHTSTWDLGLFVLNSGGFNDTFFYLWIVLMKITLIISLTIWFLTCKHWWRKAILIPLFIELFKLVSLFNGSIKFDEIEFIQSLPITIPILLILMLISKKLNYFSLTENLSNELNNEIENTFNFIIEKEGINIKEYKSEFNKIKNERNTKSVVLYMNKLIQLREKIFRL